MSQIIYEDDAYRAGRYLVKKLKENLPKQLFAVSLQAVINNKIIARETMPALRKDVTAKLYGGDYTRKSKLLQKQKKGKKKMKSLGKVTVPSETLFKIIKS
jgi:GTP-binding protein LepA